MNLKRTPLLVAPLVAITVALVGCSGGFSKRTAQKSSGIFRYPLQVEPTTFDPAKVEDVDTSDLLQNVFEGLVAYDENNKIVGRLAESWSTPDQGKTWIFKLRPGTKFSNGRTVTADDVKASIERACASGFDSPTASNYLANIVGVSEELSGKSKTISGITVSDPTTIQFVLDAPRPYFLGMLTYPCSFVIDTKVAGPTAINDVTKAIGTGPYSISKYQAQTRVELAANKSYYLGAPKLEQIIRPIIADPVTRLTAFRSGELDMITLQRGDLPGVDKDPSLKPRLKQEVRPAVYYVALNQASYKPFKDSRVRRAFAMCVNRDDISKSILNGMPPAHGLLVPGVLGFREDYKGLPFDPSTAKKLLAEAGYPNGKGLPNLTITFRVSNPDAQGIAERIQSSLRQNLNFPVKLQSMDWTLMLDARNKAKLDSYVLSWYADYLDPQNLLSLLLMSTSTQNHDAYNNPEFDRLCRLGDTTFDEKKRAEDYQKAEDIVVQEAGRVPIAYGQDSLLVSERVKGLRSNLLGPLPHTTTTVE